jgi:hypothetical protein
MATNRKDETLESIVKRRFEAESSVTCAFNIEELVASAFVLCNTLNLSQSQIRDCILDKHPYFHRLWASGAGASDSVIEKFSEDLNDCVHQLDTPFTIIELSDGDMEVSTSSGSLYSLLREVKESPKSSKPESSEQGHTSWNELPEEIKETIFRYVCVFAGYRLSFECADQNALIAYRVGPAAVGWVDEAAWSYLHFATTIIVPLRLCSKDFDSRATKVFYRHNDFQFKDLAALNHLLKRMGPGGRTHMKDITVRFHRLKQAPEVVELISDCIFLRSLTLVLNINHKTNGKIEIADDKGRGKFTYPGPSNMPGLKELKSMFVPERAKVLRITPGTTDQCVQKVEAYMFKVSQG